MEEFSIDISVKAIVNVEAATEEEALAAVKKVFEGGAYGNFGQIEGEPVCGFAFLKRAKLADPERL